jgi:hypothetical protein
MTLTDWIIDIALIGMVVLQLRGRRMRLWMLVWPLVALGWVASQYVRAVPTGGSDLTLIVAGALLGLVLGAGSGLLTRVYREDGGSVMTRATGAAALLWVLGMGSRLAFQLFATHGGGVSLARFSAAHALDIDAWVDAILFMAIAEVLGRTAVMAVRWLVLERAPRDPRKQGILV